ncbi:MAG: CPBP family intramembrane metalloprotease [Bryobacteraceae bacterium]|nr:CPBP family intramembrane metalloprotease [Bryobacteraceae bacterium]
MSPMQAYLIALAVLWIAGCIAGYSYSQRFALGFHVAVPLAAAFLLELSLYAMLAFAELRRRIDRLGPRLPPLLVSSALAPYLVYALATGVFRWQAAFALLALAAVAVFWFRVLPHRPAADLLYLAVMAAVVLGDLFEPLYAPPAPGPPVDVLGRLMWVRLGVASVLFIRRMDGIGFGFWPNFREWRIGFLYYIGFLPLGFLLTYLFQFARFHPAAGWPWKAPLTFLGFLWLVALSEEFFFRGVLQRSLAQWLGRHGSLAVASLAFGAVHLPYRQFPNWEFAALAAVAGWFYGKAFLDGNGIRAAMVTHALVVTTWRTLLR